MIAEGVSIMNRKKQILVVEHSPQIARFIQVQLEEQHYACCVEHSGGKALDRLAQEYFDLLILDIILPDVDGIMVCEKVRQFSNIPILILSAIDDIQTKVTLLSTGANDYMTKPFNSRELVARVAVLLRSLYQPARTEQRLCLQDISIHLDRHEVLVGTRHVTLTKTEFRLFAFLARNKNIVLPRITIFEEVWGTNYIGDTNIIDVYIRYIRNKLRASGTERNYIKTVRGIGYVAED